MAFIDQVKIYVKAGDGGNGCVSFRREKYVPRGGPDGGDGGRGGDIILKATENLTTLLDLKYQQHYQGKRAAHGQGKNKHGRATPDVVIPVPVGTVVRDAASGEVLADLAQEGQWVMVARGGRGGKGNARFATPTYQAPTHAEEGQKGGERWLVLELKLLADVGLVGFPNAGKSTLLSRISSARPKVADYPFTTLIPYLGMVRGEVYSYVVADIPGLIVGAHEGKGLGIQFLRHIERTKILAFLVDVSESLQEDPAQQFELLRREVTAYQIELERKPFLVVGTKTDLQGQGSRLRRLERFCLENNYPFFAISAATGGGLSAFIDFLGRRVAAGAGYTEPIPR